MLALLATVPGIDGKEAHSGASLTLRSFDDQINHDCIV